MRKSNEILERVKKTHMYKQAIERAPNDEREKLEHALEMTANMWGSIIENLLEIASDSNKANALKQKLIHIAKSGKTQE